MTDSDKQNLSSNDLDHSANNLGQSANDLDQSANNLDHSANDLSKNADNKISQNFDKYPYSQSYDCEYNFAPVTIFDINDMKNFK